jgi:NAD(P)-dependent dehydrogenase (short-subunit alcohol dehydrogenase family)
VTGANTGIGKAVAEILYSKNATVWLACRNEEKAQEAMRSIREKAPSSTGKLKFLKLDLSDLNTIKQTVDTFLAQESRLDVLFNNAGVMGPPKGAKSAQGYELQLGVNNLGPHLFTKLVTPLLVKTAKQAPKDSVRVVWVSSLLAESTSPKHGIDFENLDYKKNDSFWMEITAKKYGISKAGNYYQSTEFARRHRADGVISVVSQEQ